MSTPEHGTAAGFRVDYDCTDEGPVVRLSGSATMEQADALRDQLLAIAPTVGGDLILDLAGLQFINSTGLGAMVSAHLRCRRLGGSLKVVNPSPPILQLLTLTKLTKLIGVYATVAEARRSGAVSPSD